MAASESEEDRRKSRSPRRDKDDHDSEEGDEDSRDARKRRDRKRKRREEERRKHRKRDDDESDGDDSEDSSRRHRRKKSRRKKKSSKKRSKSSRKKKKRKHYSSSSSSEDSDDSSDDSSSNSSSLEGKEKSKVVNQKLLAKLNARGETLEERRERRSQKRAAKIQARFGYTAEENPFNDPNLHETFTWSKKKEKEPSSLKPQDTLEEIESIRIRRKEREAEKDEMERLRAEESRMKELENYDDWAKKEEEFHLEQQRKRSAIRLVEGREKPVDILAKNLLLFGLTEEEKKHQAAVKYQERYNALDELEKLEAELEEPHKIVKVLKLMELQELRVDIDAFRLLEKEGMVGGSQSSILLYWDALYVVAQDEIKFLQNGGENSSYARKVEGIKEIFEGQSRSALMKMKEEIDLKLRKAASGTAFDSEGGVIDRDYWQAVKEQLLVQLAKMDLSELHSKMLVRQLEKLEQRKEKLAEQQKNPSKEEADEDQAGEEAAAAMIPKNVEPDFGNREKELTDEVDLLAGKTYSWKDRYAPRKPRYFNRVKTGYDWNKYNQTHYDPDNPPPKTVQGYKFNIFYPELVDPTKTPQYFLEPADSDDFCILRFHAGAPYEDIAFKIINREWNRSRKRGFRCTFERGVLSLYFNFTTHWYRR